MRDDVHALMSKTSAMMLSSSIMELLSVIAVAAASNFIFTGLPPYLASRYSDIAFPSFNLVTGVVLLIIVLSVIGGFMTYMSRGSLERREFLSLGNILYTAVIIAASSLVLTAILLVLYSTYIGFGSIAATQSLTLGFTSLIASIGLSGAAFTLLYMAMINARELRRRYRPRALRRQRPPPPPPDAIQGDYGVQY